MRPILICLLALLPVLAPAQHHDHGTTAQGATPPRAARPALGASAAFGPAGRLWAVHAEPQHVVLSVSDDAGRHWSRVGPVNADPEPIAATGDNRPKIAFGKAGQLLDRMLGAIGLSRDGDDVYICNVLKCRPPGNRDPHLDEVGACRAFLDEQLRLLKPEVVLELGAHAARTVLGTHRGISSLRGRFLTSPAGWRVMPTWHPAYLLRQPDAKREAWADLQKVAAALGLSIPPRA